MKARILTGEFTEQVAALWSARLAVQNAGMAAAPSTEKTTYSDPFAEADRIAAELHGAVEMPPHGSRQSRATLERLAFVALRKAP